MLLVDDEEFCLCSLKSMLLLCGFNINDMVDIAFNGQEALNQIKKAYELGITYKLIITDVSMPIMDGIDGTRAIRDYLANSRGLSREQ